jgi:alanine dehydrogenase
MDFGVPKEVRESENRVGLTPAGVHALVEAGNRVYVERGAGLGAGFTEENFRAVGAEIVYSADEAYGRADVVAKVSRLTEKEYALLRAGQTILSFMHLAVASRDLAESLTEHRITAIAYELIQTDDGRLPVLAATSEVAGRLAPIIAGNVWTASRAGVGFCFRIDRRSACRSRDYRCRRGRASAARIPGNGRAGDLARQQLHQT